MYSASKLLGDPNIAAQKALSRRNHTDEQTFHAAARSGCWRIGEVGPILIKGASRRGAIKRPR
jgi:hypothetical protein